MSSKFARLLVIVAVLALGFLAIPHAHAAPATFTVNVTSDEGDAFQGDGICETANTGECTLRAAIEEANGNVGADTIEFNIPGSGVHTIAPSSVLPSVNEQLTINGYSQPGAQANTAVAPNPLNGTLKIELDLSSVVGAQAGLSIAASNSTVKGLAIYSSSDTQVYVLFNASNGVFRGNYTGLKADGVTRVNSSGVTLDNGVSALWLAGGNSGTIIGGTAAADRNVIIPASTSTGSGTVRIESDDSTVQGNYIGLAPDGVTSYATSVAGLSDLGDGSGGIVLAGTNVLIGGTAPGAKNVISGSEAFQINLSGGQNNAIQGNYIGTDYTGTARESIVNGTGVLAVASAQNHLIGGTGAGEGNVIAGVSGSGVLILTIDLMGTVVTPSANALLGNTIRDIRVLDYPEFGDSNLGIDIGIETIVSFSPFAVTFDDQGPTLNDAGDADVGANGYINSPVLKSAQQIGNQLTITYDLDAADSPTDDYRVEFFANDNSTIFGSGPGENYLGAAASVSPGTGKTITLTVNEDVTDMALSATTTAIDATPSSGFGSTSEFAKNISIGSAADFDSDGASDAVENAAPNNGDANDDGTADRLQPTVTSFEIDSTGIYETLVTSGCSENGTIASIDVSALAKNDTGKSYPYGLVDFTLNCSRGDTVNVTKYVFVDDQPSEFVLRKYNPGSETYTDVSGSSIASQDIGGNAALVSTYSITDGGQYDDDGLANGIIVDPVGLATTQSLAQTGQNIWVYLCICIATIFGGIVITRRVERSC